MINHQEALRLITENVRPLRKKLLTLDEAAGCVLAESLRSRIDLPGFDNTAVDGYAVGNISRTDEIKVTDEIKAGDSGTKKVRENCAARIFTGSPVPPGTRAVIMQEDVHRVNGHINLLELPRAGVNIRRKGEDICKGQMILERGCILSARHIGLLAATGHAAAPVIPKPRVAILATGSELIRAGKRLRKGAIYDSNSPMLKELVREHGGIPVEYAFGIDRKEVHRREIKKGLKQDVLIVTGGVSVGDYDFVKELFQELGVKEVFWKVRIKPGKPLFFGIKGKTCVFGLPGNPVSAFVTFHEYVARALQILQGKQVQPVQTDAFMDGDFRNSGRLHFVRVHCRTNANGSTIVTPLSGQGSHMIGALSRANGIMTVEPSAVLTKGETVRVSLIDPECVSCR